MRAKGRAFIVVNIATFAVIVLLGIFTPLGKMIPSSDSFFSSVQSAVDNFTGGAY